MKRHLAICDDPIDVDHLFAVVAAPEAGAVTSFLGTVRISSGAGERTSPVVRLEYEAYAPMAIAEMERIADEAFAEFGVVALAIEHRVGQLAIGEVAVAIVVSTPHRDASFGACRYAIEELKRRVPIWKKEVFVDGAEWAQNRP